MVDRRSFGRAASHDRTASAILMNIDGPTAAIFTEVEIALLLPTRRAILLRGFHSLECGSKSE